MTTLLALFATLVRLVKPSQATHGSPYGRVAGILEELRRNRSRRVRRYAEVLPAVADTEPLALPASPVVPAPRTPAVGTLPRAVLAPVPADYVPVVQPDAVAEPAEMVRGHYREWERRQRLEALARADRSRLGVTALSATATTPKAGV